MTAPEYLAFAAALFLGVPAMLRNWTAVGLVASFAIMQALYLAVRDGLIGSIPLEVYILCDFIVLTVIFLKGPPIEREAADSLFSLVKRVWLELSRSDKIIAVTFLPCWISYAVHLTGPQRYWILWTLGVLQFFVAGGEAYAAWRRGRARTPLNVRHPADWFLRLAGHGW